MKFEHLIEVNDLANPLLTPLTREELWFGLLCRAEDARAFLPGLEACHVVERGEDSLVRDLEFLYDVPLQVSVEVGRARILLKDLLQMGEGSVVELDKMAGEPLDQPTHEWFMTELQKPVIDNYWQTETGWPMLSAMPGKRVQKR